MLERFGPVLHDAAAGYKSGVMMTAALVALTMIAFAGNSLLGRMALEAELIDPISFTAIRLASGAMILLFVSRIVG